MAINLSTKGNSKSQMVVAEVVDLAINLSVAPPALTSASVAEVVDLAINLSIYGRGFRKE